MSTAAIIRTCLEDIIGVAIIFGFVISMKPYHLHLVPNKDNFSLLLSEYTSEFLLASYLALGIAFFFLIRCWTARLHYLKLQQVLRDSVPQNESESHTENKNADTTKQESNKTIHDLTDNDNDDENDEDYTPHRLRKITTIEPKPPNTSPPTDSTDQPPAPNPVKRAVTSSSTSTADEHQGAKLDMSLPDTTRNKKTVRRSAAKKRQKARERAAGTRL